MCFLPSRDIDLNGRGNSADIYCLLLLEKKNSMGQADKEQGIFGYYITL